MKRGNKGDGRTGHAWADLRDREGDMVDVHASEGLAEAREEEERRQMRAKPKMAGDDFVYQVCYRDSPLKRGIRAVADLNRLLELQRASQQTGISSPVCSTARIPKERRSRSGSRPTRRARGRAEPSMDSRACMLRPLSLFSSLCQVCAIGASLHCPSGSSSGS